MKPFFSLVCGGIALACQCLALPFSSVESPLLEIDTGGRTPAVTSAATAELVINTRGGAAASLNSAFLTLDTRGAGTLSVPVKIVDGQSADLPGVTITVRQNGVVVATATSDGFGAARLAGLLAGYHEFRAEKAGYLTQLRPHVRVPEDLPDVLAFLMASPPGVPPLKTTEESPLASALGELDLTQPLQLKLFQGDAASGAFISLHRPDPTKMTIVLTHGLWSSSSNWPLDMARSLVAVAGMKANANIVAWDWKESAGNALARQHTSRQGLALGQALWDALGDHYTRPIHFIGHSFGTLVNGAAVNYLHGDDAKNRLPTSFPPWDPRRTQVTLLDEAELAPNLRLDWKVLNWSSPVPEQFAYLDNYLTSVGFYQSRGVNVFLQRAKHLDPVGLHGYPHEWYQWTIRRISEDLIGGTQASDLGFRYSFEVLGDQATFPAPALYPEGSLFIQDEASDNILDLVKLKVPEGLVSRTALELVTHSPAGVFTYSLRATRFGVETATYVVDAVSTAAVAGARKIGQVSVGVVETVLDHYGGSLNPLDDPVYGVGGTTPAVLGIPGYGDASTPVPVWSLRLNLQTQPPAPTLSSRGQRPAKTGLTPTNTPAYVWLPVHVPADAVAVAFDFKLSGEGADDRVVAGVNDTNVFSLAARFIADDRPMSSGPLPVEAWAGQDVELFFGLAGGTSTDARLTVESIRFLGLPVPVLRARPSDAGIVLEWTEASPGFVLEWTAGLTAAPVWTPVTDVGGYPGQRTVTNQAPASQGLYRLRRP